MLMGNFPNIDSEEMTSGKATCASAGLGKPARITCQFGQNDVEASDVSVVLLRRLDGKQEKVVECYRYEKKFDCLHVDGYKINDIISDQMITNITRTPPEHQGIYSCEIVRKQTTYQIGSCVLEYEESNNATTSTPPLDRDDNRQEELGTSDAKVWIHATIVLSVLLVILMLFAVLVFVRRRRRRQRYRRQKDTDEENPGNEIDSCLPASNSGDGNGLCKMNFNTFPYTCTKVKDLLLGVSTGDNVGIAAKRPYSSETYSPAKRTPSSTKDNSQGGNYKSRWVVYNGDFEKS